LGLDAGKSLRFADLEQANSLRWTIADLAKARPGIRVSELAELSISKSMLPECLPSAQYGMTAQ
jgi:hypothetical protein